MSKSHRGARGPQGIAGPPGPAGTMGLKGHRGSRGFTGKTGTQGTAGFNVDTRGQRKKFVSAVRRHIDRIDTRLSELQREMNELRSKIRLL